MDVWDTLSELFPFVTSGFIIALTILYYMFTL